MFTVVCLKVVAPPRPAVLPSAPPLFLFAKGTLLQQKKELELHCDIKSGDRLLFFSTLGWVSGLACLGLASRFSCVLSPILFWYI